jgi:hypothetical protein
MAAGTAGNPGKMEGLEGRVFEGKSFTICAEGLTKYAKADWEGVSSTAFQFQKCIRRREVQSYSKDQKPKSKNT